MMTAPVFLPLMVFPHVGRTQCSRELNIARHHVCEIGFDRQTKVSNCLLPNQRAKVFNVRKNGGGVRTRQSG
ncbi:hypothetical protein BDV97DRAFT_360540 [Delphinella strobiligena]|nr:hypothetical protein BDV97DRAFT_360540 [Delphinella strobiligena]